MIRWSYFLFLETVHYLETDGHRQLRGERRAAAPPGSMVWGIVKFVLSGREGGVRGLAGRRAALQMGRRASCTGGQDTGYVQDTGSRIAEGGRMGRCSLAAASYWERAENDWRRGTGMRRRVKRGVSNAVDR